MLTTARNFSSAVALLSSRHVIALHDDDLAGFLTPALTTVALPVKELGIQAVELALDMAAEGEPRRVVVPRSPHLIERASTAAVR
ncbi:substrate-binding domain-containing protein [Streptomyces werraensis]|uniref:substrate-binding domain-containing protein n=1 Tax=Streptomyces werraensis TaxID=68284 RepID=UPI001CE31636